MKIKSKIVFLIIFGIAMGFLEAAVVVYLRQLYYPEGFAFPLKLMAWEELSIEYLREISTIVMLFSIGIVAGKNFYERFAYFLFCFGIWDIFYYIWLKVLLNWPPSLLTWDILFLIPVVWVGPVSAPLICAITMIMIAGCILFFQQKGYPVRINSLDWVLLFLGAFIIFSTFIWDYTKIIIQGGFISRLSTLGADLVFKKEVSQHVPTIYKWPLFIIGEILILYFLIRFCNRMRLLRSS
ncbi:MAG: hypothetical protein AB1480_09340 [Nitrospirota bacterium]